VAQEITRRLRIPTIGIGSGAGCDGQVLVLHDMLGFDEERTLRHTRRYAEIGRAIRGAAESYVQDVRSGEFPRPEHATLLGEGAGEVLSAMRRVEGGGEAPESPGGPEATPYGGGR
jgi:3-methyl-2-oxobutanoate hydroxymethyltransferase